MTVCIAAGCVDGDERKLLLCIDWLRSGVLGKAETSLKVKMMPGKWYVLTSGDDDEIAAMDLLFRRAFSKLKGKVDETNAVQIVRDVVLARKREKISELIGGRYAMSYERFVECGRSFLPEDEYRQVMATIKEPLRAEFIIAGLPEGFPFIVECAADGSTHVRESFAVIGAGAYLAQASLLHREQVDVQGLGPSLYNVFEAKKYAEREVSVGTKTTIFVVDKERERVISEQTMKWFDKQYRRFGPREVVMTNGPDPQGIYDTNYDG